MLITCSDNPSIRTGSSNKNLYAPLYTTSLKMSTIEIKSSCNNSAVIPVSKMNAYCSGSISYRYPSIANAMPAPTSDVSNTFSTASKIDNNVSLLRKLLILTDKSLTSMNVSSSITPLPNTSVIMIATASAINLPSSAKLISEASIEDKSRPVEETKSRISSSLTSNNFNEKIVSIRFSTGAVLFQSILSFSNNNPNRFPSTNWPIASRILVKSTTISLYGYSDKSANPANSVFSNDGYTNVSYTGSTTTCNIWSFNNDSIISKISLMFSSLNTSLLIIWPKSLNAAFRLS